MIIAPVRRCGLALLSMALAFIVLRPLIADALTMRGDEFLRSGEPLMARHYYRFALASDPDCEAATERLVFSGLEIHTHAMLVESVRFADLYLQRHNNSAIRIDRALALWSLKDFRRAERELRILGALTHDARYARLAQNASRRLWRAR